MISNEILEKLQHIILGDLLEGQGEPCTTTRNLLAESVGSDPTVKSEFQSRTILKKSQENFLKTYWESSGLWLLSIPDASQYLARGGESSVYNNLTRRGGFSCLLGKIVHLLQLWTIGIRMSCHRKGLTSKP